MKYKFLFLIIILSVFYSCNQKNNKIVEYNEVVYQPKHASGYQIKKSNDSSNINISIYNPWQGAKNEISDFLIINEEDYDSKDFPKQYLLKEAKRIVCMSSTHIAMLDELDATDRIVGVSGKSYVSNPKVRENKEIKDVGYEGNIDYETLISIKPDIVLLYSVNSASGMEPKLKEFGIPYIYIGDYMEESPLGKAEWMVAIGELIGKREIGIEKFHDIENQYLNLKEKVAQGDFNRPKIMVNAPYSDSWFMPSSDSYIANMIDDAGGEYIYKKIKGNSSRPIDMEEAFKLVAESDYWINPGTANSIDELKSMVPKLSIAGLIQEGKIYNNNYRSTPGSGNDFFESGTVNPHIVLKDLIKIFHPELIDENFTYYHRLE